ncbi:hypothetical protein JTE90_013072 [Oedothorax gibbosus]|uniref:Uncharacterized protein n=1 Tax=Oedothorax gibbosus TaxID=931172 RepID=A0AAV6UKJ1_9ARAC|nr:hypothetical protein JTE90_013072 [Oedothorax gibbosus]
MQAFRFLIFSLVLLFLAGGQVEATKGTRKAKSRTETPISGSALLSYNEEELRICPRGYGSLHCVCV